MLFSESVNNNDRFALVNHKKGGGSMQPGAQIASDRLPVKILKRARLFEGIPEVLLKQIAAITHDEFFQEGGLLIEQGTRNNYLYIIEEGQVKVVREEDGVETELAVLGPGQILGEMSMIEDSLASANVVATGQYVDCLKIQHSEFLDLLERQNQIKAMVYENFCHILSERLRESNRKLSQGQRKSKIKVA